MTLDNRRVIIERSSSSSHSSFLLSSSTSFSSSPIPSRAPALSSSSSSSISPPSVPPFPSPPLHPHWGIGLQATRLKPSYLLSLTAPLRSFPYNSSRSQNIIFSFHVMLVLTIFLLLRGFQSTSFQLCYKQVNLGFVTLLTHNSISLPIPRPVVLRGLL